MEQFLIEKLELTKEQILSVKIITDKSNPNVSKGYAYVTLSTHHLLETVLAKTKTLSPEELEFHGRVLKI